MGFLSVIRRWALRDKMPIREITRRTGLSRNTIKKYLREGAVEPKFKVPQRPSKLDPYADRLSAWLLAQARKSRKERRTVKLMYEDLVSLVMTDLMSAWRLLPGHGELVGNVRSKRQDAAPMCLWCSSRAKRFSLIGAKTGAALVENGSNFRSPISSSRTVGRSWCARIPYKHTRCCLIAFRVFGGVPRACLCVSDSGFPYWL